MATKKLTPAQSKLLARLPAFFQVSENYNQSNCPRSEIRGENGEERSDWFGKGELKAFQGLLASGAVVRLGKVESVKNHIIVAYGKER